MCDLARKVGTTGSTALRQSLLDSMFEILAENWQEIHRCSTDQASSGQRTQKFGPCHFLLIRFPVVKIVFLTSILTDILIAYFKSN